MDKSAQHRALGITILMLLSIIVSSVTNVSADNHDTDGDGYSDEEETDCGSNPDDWSDLPQDSDGDGWCDGKDAFPYEYYYHSDNDNDGTADELDYCSGTSLAINENASSSGCSDVQLSTINDDHNTIQESQIFNTMATNQIFLNPVSFNNPSTDNTFHRWWGVNIPQGSNVDQFQFNYTINTTGVSDNLPLGIRLHSNSGTCGSNTFTAYQSSSQSPIICDRPNTGGELFIHLYSTGTIYQPSTMNINMSIAPYSSNQNPPTPFIDVNGDGDLGFDSTLFYSTPAEISQTIYGNFNRSSNDHVDYITYNTSLVNVNRIRVNVGMNVVRSSSGLSDCNEMYSLLGSMELDCLITAPNPKIEIEDKQHLVKYSTGMYYNGTECGTKYNRSIIAEAQIDSFDISITSSNYIRFQTNISDTSNLSNESLLQVRIDNQSFTQRFFDSTNAGSDIIIDEYISSALQNRLYNGECILFELLLLKDSWTINAGIKQWTVSSTLQNVHPIEDLGTGDNINSGQFISQGEGFVGHLGYDFDLSDSFKLEIPHGKELKIVLDTSTPIRISLPFHETCDSDYSDNNPNVANSGWNSLILPYGSHRIICEVNSSANNVEFTLQHWDWNTEENRSQTTSYQFSISERFQLSQYCCDNDSESGKDASNNDGIHLQNGTYNGSFIHLTDQHDRYTITVPKEMGLLTFVQGIDLDTFLDTREGDIQYNLRYNSGEQEMDMSTLIPNPDNMQSPINQYCYYSSNNWTPFPFGDSGYDSDGDGLTDMFEDYDTGTDPYDYDSDDGGENDCLEYKYGRDPNNPNDDYFVPDDYDYSMSEKIDYVISFHLIEVGIPIELIQDSIPSFITTGQTKGVSFSEGSISDAMVEWRLEDNLPSSFDIGLQDVSLIPLEWSPLEAMELTITQASGLPVSFRIGDNTRFNQISGSESIIISKVVDNVADYQNMEYNYLQLISLDGSEVTIKTSTVSMYDTEEGDDIILQHGVTRYGDLGYGTEGYDNSDSWIYSVPYGSYSIFEITKDNGHITHDYGNQVPRTETFSDMVVRCNWEYNNSIQVGFNDTININLFASNRASYSITHNVYEGDCPLNLGAELKFSGQGVDQSDTSLRISPGNSLIIQSTTILNSSNGFDLRMLNQTGEVVDSTVRVNNDASSKTATSHQLLGDSRSVTIVEIPSDLADGVYTMQMRFGQVTVDELHIIVSSVPECEITNAYPDNVISPMENPIWLVNSHDDWDGSSFAWNVIINESWVRDVNGSPMEVGLTSGSTTPGKGFGMIETSLSSDMRVGSVLHHHITCEQEQIVRSFNLDSRVSRIDLQLSGPSSFLFDQNEPIQDVRYTISSELELDGRPVAGVSGHLSMTDSYGLERRNISFITDGLGIDHLTISIENLYAGEYDFEIHPNEQWREKVRLNDKIELSVDDSDQIFVEGEDIRDLILTADLRRDILTGGENIAIDWSSEGQDISSIRWVLYEKDSSGSNLIVAANQNDNILSNKGVISITIPTDLHPTNGHILYLVVNGVYGGQASKSFSIDGLSLIPEMVIAYSPVQPSPGEGITFTINCDCIGSYLYWTWELRDNNGFSDEGKGWVAANEASFVVDLPFSLRNDVTITISGRDSEGRIFSASESIALKDTVDINIEVPFYANVGESLGVDWEITSDSLTEVDKVVKIEIELYSFESSEILARTVSIENSYSGSTSLIIPADLKPGSYSIHVTTVLSSGSILEQTSLIEVHDPILGLSAMAMTPEVNRWMIVFVAVNVIAIWAMMIRSSRRRSDIKDDDIDEFIAQNEEPIPILSKPLISLNQQSPTVIQIERPNETMFGTFDAATGFEWLEYPVGSGNNWWRGQIGEPWNSFDQQNG
jgi:hypothetical protein